MKQVICMKWGTQYPADYVNRLANMVDRNTTGEVRFLCLTDDPTGLAPRIECLGCPTVPIDSPKRNQGWRKLSLFAPDVFGLEGDALFLDLDIVIVDNIDPLFDHPGRFVVMRNWTQPDKRIGNTSVFRFTFGKHTEVWDRLASDPAGAIANYPNSQTFVSDTIEGMEFFPDEWCLLYKVHCLPHPLLRWFAEPRLPAGARIVAFPGAPKPPDAAAGRWPAPFHKRIYKHNKPAGWVREHWR